MVLLAFGVPMLGWWRLTEVIPALAEEESRWPLQLSSFNGCALTDNTAAIVTFHYSPDHTQILTPLENSSPYCNCSLTYPSATTGTPYRIGTYPLRAICTTTIAHRNTTSSATTLGDGIDRQQHDGAAA